MGVRPGRQFVDGAHVQIGKVAHGQGARDGRGAHHQQVRLQRLFVELLPQCQALRHAEAVLLVHHRQAQARKHHIGLDHRMGAHHQAGLARGHHRQHRGARLALAAAGEPGHLHAQRLQPAHQLAKVLLGQDLGGRHQRALPARVDGHRRGQCRDHGLARAHVALQQAVHGARPGQVGADLGHHALLGRRQCKGQVCQQAGVQAFMRGRQRRRSQQRTRGVGLGLRKLLGQQFLELQALPGRVAVVFQRGQGVPGAGWCSSISASRKVGRPGGSTSGGSSSAKCARASAEATALRR
jgi:hypothetical protein